MSFSQLGLSTSMVKALEALGISQAFPVQTRAIGPILQGKDLWVEAQTGSGKTLAFTAPILDKLIQSGNRKNRCVRTLVLAPTRELALQIGDVAASLGAFLPVPPVIRTAVGGMSLENQSQSLARGADFFVATPGRLLDLLRRQAVDLSKLEFLVLDEADKMLELGFSGEITEIRGLIPQTRQSLLFSATMKTATEALVSTFLKDYIKISLEVHEVQAPKIEEKVYLVKTEEKGPFLREVLKEGGWAQVLVFVSSARRADNVVRKLNANGLQAQALHGDMGQNARSEAFARFKALKVRILVATDIAARGLDVHQLPCVINYELPRSVKDYVHRIGRTGRARQAGLAITLVSPEEEPHLKLTEKFIKRKLERVTKTWSNLTQTPPRPEPDSKDPPSQA